MTRIRTAAVTVLVLGATTVIDIAPSTAETYRPWCAQYSGRVAAETAPSPRSSNA
jgi:hypothetical protein